MTHSNETLALFTMARRKHLKISQDHLAGLLKINASSIRACEAARKFAKSARAAVLKFNELKEV